MSNPQPAMAEEFQEVSPEVFFWQAYDPAVRAELSCCAVKTGHGLVFIDPIPLRRDALEELVSDATPLAVVLTNGNHARAAAWYREKFAIDVIGHSDAEAELGLRLDRHVREGDIVEGLSILELSGAGAGEIALNLPGCSLNLGDAVINMEGHGFSLLPDKYCTNSKKLRENVRKLLKLEFHLVTFAHGLPLVNRSRERLVQICA